MENLLFVTVISFTIIDLILFLIFGVFYLVYVHYASLTKLEHGLPFICKELRRLINRYIMPSAVLVNLCLASNIMILFFGLSTSIYSTLVVCGLVICVFLLLIIIFKSVRLLGGWTERYL